MPQIPKTSISSKGQKQYIVVVSNFYRFDLISINYYYQEFYSVTDCLKAFFLLSPEQVVIYVVILVINFYLFCME